MRALLVVLVLLALPLAGAQSHSHGGAGSEGPLAVVLHDGPDDGRAVVGGLTHLGFALLDEDGVPVPHRDATITLTQNGRVLLQSASTHEYDGLLSLDVTFHEAGPYEVLVESEGFAPGMFTGEAVPPANATLATVEMVPRLLPGTGAAELTIQVLDAEGRLMPHTDVMLELRKASGRFVGRTHLHIHDEPITLLQSLPVDGEGGYVLEATGYLAFPTGRSRDIVSTMTRLELDAVPGAAPPALPAAPRPTSALSPKGATAEAEGYALHGTYDPQPLVGLRQPIRLAGTLVDANGTPVPHVDFAFTVTGPAGLVFASDSLHEYDGSFEWAFAAALPGLYDATLTASRGDLELTIPYQFTVAPPVLPLDAGAHSVELEMEAEPTAGIATPLLFRVSDDLGRPLAHSEVDITVFREGEAATYQLKLHAHGDGTMAADLAFPTEGTWLVRVDPFTLMPQASLVEPALFEVQVLAGAALVQPAADVAGTAPVPAAGLLPLVAALGAAAAVFARRR